MASKSPTTKRRGRPANKPRAGAISVPPPNNDPIDPEADAVARYREQVAIVDGLFAEWNALGRPATCLGGATGEAVVIHPLVRELQAANMRAARLLKDTLPKGKPGRPVGTPDAPDRRPRIRLVSDGDHG